MKLYSRGQVLFFSVASALVVLLLAFGFGFLGDRAGGFGDLRGSSPSEGIGPESTFRFETNPGSEGLSVTTSAGSDYTEDEFENIRIFEMRNEGVVNITTETIAYTWFLEPVPARGTTGSGSIIDSRGYVLTNQHVVEGAERVYVTLSDGTTLQGEVIGSDAENDLAIIEFDPGNHELRTVPFGDSADLRVGQKVLAIGNPFALDRTLTTGIISGLGRSLRNDKDLIIQGMIQTDASINPGNSGGPLLDSHGDMIGINTMIYSQTGGSIGIGFAVPVDTARRVVPDLIEFGIVRRGWIEIIPRAIIPQIAAREHVSAYRGLLVSQVDPGGNADQAGIRGGNVDDPVRYGKTIIYLGGDIIIEVDGTEVNSIANFYEALEDNLPGETVSVVYLRNNRRRETTVTLVDRPARYQWD
ncbi:MAG: trypsin-like peptidase domain-containing protein [Spirochaetia bacterium]